MIQPWNCCYTCGKVEAGGKVILRDIAGKMVETVNKLLTCIQCHTNVYCSKECQRKDWAKHKPFCIESKSILSKEILSKTILLHFQNELQHRISKGRTLPVELGYLVILIERMKLEHVKEDDTNYQELTIESNGFMHLKSELDKRIKDEKLPEDATELLKEFKALSAGHPDKLLINIAYKKQTVNFMFRLCEKISVQELVDKIDINRSFASILISLVFRNSITYSWLSPEGQKLVKQIVNCVELLRFSELNNQRDIKKIQGRQLRAFGFSDVDKITFSYKQMCELYVAMARQASNALSSLSEKQEAKKVCLDICLFTSQISSSTSQITFTEEERELMKKLTQEFFGLLIQAHHLYDPDY